MDTLMKVPFDMEMHCCSMSGGTCHGCDSTPLLHASSFKIYLPQPQISSVARTSNNMGLFVTQNQALSHTEEKENNKSPLMLSKKYRRSLSPYFDFRKHGSSPVAVYRRFLREWEQDDGMMSETANQQDAAMNLATHSEGKESSVPNGDIRQNGTDNGHDTALTPPSQGSTPNKVAIAVVGAAKRKLKSSSVDTPTRQTSPQHQVPNQSQQPLLMMAAQHGLSPQQVQQLLQQQLVSPQHLQQMMQQQQSLMAQHQQQQQKLHDNVLHQLNDQLQLNVLQQSQIIQQQQQQQEKTKNSKQTQQQLQQLALQQQQLIQQIQQIQLQQRQYLLACLVQPFGGLPQSMMSHAEIQQLWKEVAAQSGLEENSMKNNLNGLTIPSVPVAAVQSPILPTPNFTNGGLLPDGLLFPGGLPTQSPISLRPNDSAKSSHNESKTNGIDKNNPLYRHNLCKWPGCDTPCEDYSTFLKHLNSEHVLDDRNTAQARVQQQVVSQLEIQLSREKELLQSMMQHLHMKPYQNERTSERHEKQQLPQQQQQQQQIQQQQPQLSPQPKVEPKPEPVSLNTPILPKHPALSIPYTTAPSLQAIPVSMVTSPMIPMASPMTPTSQIPAATSLQSPPSAGTIRRRVSDKCNLPISAGKFHSEEIQRNRDFYKSTDVRPPFTYASLIRQAIIESPHRQLTLNEVYQWFQNTFAYFRRNEATWKNAVRHNLSLHKCFMRVENVKGAVWTVDEVEFYKRRPQKLTGNMKSPSMSDPSSYNETLNASLRAALGDHPLGENSLALLSAAHLGDQESAEDLSMKSHSNSQDGFSSNRDEDMMAVKQEPGLDDEHIEYLEPEDPDEDGIMQGDDDQADMMAEESSEMIMEEHSDDASQEHGIEEATSELLEAEEQELLALQQMQQEAAMVAVAAHSSGV